MVHCAQHDTQEIDSLFASLAEGDSVAVWVKRFYAHAKRIVLELCVRKIDAVRSEHFEVVPEIIGLNEERAWDAIGRRARRFACWPRAG